MMHLLAHADKFHDVATTSTEHILLRPLVYGGLNLIIVIAVVIGLRMRHVSLGTQLLSAMGLLLAGGVLGYQYVPVVGGIMIAIGITLALGTTLLNLAAESQANHHEK